MAVIIGRSIRPLAEKQKAWRELASDYPDMPTLKNINHDSYPSLHKKLTEAIGYYDRLLELFRKPETGAVYTYKAWRHDRYDQYGDSIYSIFVTLEETVTAMQRDWGHDEVTKFKIEKIYIGDRGTIVNSCDYEGNSYDIITSIDFPHLLPDDSFIDFHFDFYVDIPTPFKKGDILTFRDRFGRGENEMVFVLESLTRDDERLHRICVESGDGCDLSGWGYFVNDGGVLYGDHVGPHDGFEYYRGELEGNHRLFHYVSLFLFERIGLAEMLAVQCRIVAENQLSNHFRIDIHGCSIPKDLRAENKITAEEEEKTEQSDGLISWVAERFSIHQIKFLMKELGVDSQTIQTRLIKSPSDEGFLLGRCADIVHEENHYYRNNDVRYNEERRAMARMILEKFGRTENWWADSYGEDEEKM